MLRIRRLRSTSSAHQGQQASHYHYTCSSSYRAGILTGTLLSLLLFSLLLTVHTITNYTAEKDRRNLQIPFLSTKSIGDSNESVNTLDLLPGTQSIVLQIGSNDNPILPHRKEGPCALSIAFEPIVPERIPKHPQIVVIPAAVSGNSNSALSAMYVYNTNAVSSSLRQARNKETFAEATDLPQQKIVPVLSLKHVLQAIPSHVQIQMLDTDMQSMDFATVASAMDEIRRRAVPYLKTETYLTVSKERVSDYQNATPNDLCLDWLPFMIQAGYHLVGTEVGGRRNVVPGFESTEAARETCQIQNPVFAYREVDALWSLTASDDHLDAFAYLRITNNTKLQFTKDEYESCR